MSVVRIARSTHECDRRSETQIRRFFGVACYANAIIMGRCRYANHVMFRLACCMGGNKQGLHTSDVFCVLDVGTQREDLL